MRVFPDMKEEKTPPRVRKLRASIEPAAKVRNAIRVLRVFALTGLLFIGSIRCSLGSSLINSTY
jgi:hypothetical protein